MANKWLEKELEDYIADNPSEFWKVPDNSEPLVIIGRQVKCTFGRIDLLAYQGTTLYVIECKAVKAGQADVGQVMRYAMIAENILDKIIALSEFRRWKKTGRNTGGIDYTVKSILVAPSFDRNLQDTGMDLVVATQTKTGFEFSYLNTLVGDGSSNADLYEIMKPLAPVILGSAVGKAIGRQLIELDGKFNPIPW